MSVTKAVAVAVLLGTGVLALTTALAGIVFAIAYDADVSPTGTAAAFFFGVIATTIGARAGGVRWRELVFQIVALTGVTLAGATIRSFGLSGMGVRELFVVTIGIAMVLVGVFGMNRIRRTGRTSARNTRRRRK